MALVSSVRVVKRSTVSKRSVVIRRRVSSVFETELRSGVYRAGQQVFSNIDSAARSVMTSDCQTVKQKTDDDERRASATLASPHSPTLRFVRTKGGEDEERRGLRSSDTHSTQHDQRVKSFAIDRPRG